MTADSNHDHELLLMAYLDGELDAEDRARAEALISENPVYASQLEQWRENGDAIRSLPRYRLGDEFTGRVMKAIENTDSLSDFSEPKTPPVGVAKNENNNWRISLAAIATLAAMLLLTLFVFPALNAPPSPLSQLDVSAKDFAKEEIAQEKIAQDFPQDNLAKSEIGAAKAVVESADVASASDAEADEAFEGNAESFHDGLAASEMQKNKMGSARSGGLGAPAPDRAKSIPGANEPAAAIASAPPVAQSDSRLGVERVLWIETKSPTAIEDIEKVLANNSIQLAAGNKGQANVARYRADSPKQAIFVISTASQMSKAIRELSKDPRNTVTAYPLQQNVDGLQPTENPHGSARQIAPLPLNQKKSDELEDSDDAEIARVDKWFDLAGDDDDSGPQRFLIFVTSSPESKAASDE